MENQLPALPAESKLWQLEVIEPKHLEQLSPHDLLDFETECRHKLAELTGPDREALLKQIKAVRDCDDIWELNHDSILDAIKFYIADMGTMPTKAQLAKATGLSRQAVHRHMKHFGQTQAYQNLWESFELLTPELMTRLVKDGLKGDSKSSKIFLDFMKERNKLKDGKTIDQQHNYIQINSTTINQEFIQQLTPAQLGQIEEMVKSLQPPKADEKAG